MIPPAFVYVRLPRPGARMRRFFLPVVLLWPLAIPLAMLAEVLAAAAGAAMLPFGYERAKKVALFVPRVNALVCALRGLTVRVSAPGRELHVWIR